MHGLRPCLEGLPARRFNLRAASLAQPGGKHPYMLDVRNRINWPGLEAWLGECFQKLGGFRLGGRIGP